MGSIRIFVVSILAALMMPGAALAQVLEPPSVTFGVPAITATGSRSTAICGPGDRPETGMQGETPLKDMESGQTKSPYNCGMRIIGNTNIMNLGGGLLKRSRSCAYVSTSGQNGGVAVIDVSNPAAPKPVKLLKDPGAIGTSETMDVVDVDNRHLLVVGEYSNGLSATAAPFSIYDTSVCTDPKLITSYYWPGDLHIVKISPDGKRVYASRPFGTAGVMILDIADPGKPKFLGNFPLVMPGGRQQRCHDMEFNENETRMYCAGSVPMPDNRKDLSGPSIWDVSQISSGAQNPSWPAIRFVGESTIKGQGDHHAPRVFINGKPYLVAANELRTNAFPRIFDISDEKAPRPVSDFRLEANDRALADPAWAKANTAAGYGLHYNNVVDNAWGNVAIGMFSFMGSGMRIVDLRDPMRPREVAYYKPAASTVTPGTGRGGRGGAISSVTPNDTCISQGFFIHETGQIWFSCTSGGFYVAELSSAVKAYLGVREKAKQP
jgi:hypothetical protein